MSLASDDMDDSSEENLQRLKQEAEDLIRANEDRLEEVCARLGQSSKRENPYSPRL